VCQQLPVRPVRRGRNKPDGQVMYQLLSAGPAPHSILRSCTDWTPLHDGDTRWTVICGHDRLRACSPRRKAIIKIHASHCGEIHYFTSTERRDKPWCAVAMEYFPVPDPTEDTMDINEVLHDEEDDSQSSSSTLHPDRWPGEWLPHAQLPQVTRAAPNGHGLPRKCRCV
jgi:hypothetical protein